MGASIASQVVPRRLNTNLGQFIENEAPMDYANVGVRFVNINDEKYNEELFVHNEIDRIGGKGFLVAGTDNPADWTGGNKKVVEGLDDIKGWLDTLGTKEEPDVPLAASVATPEAAEAAPAGDAPE